MHMGTSVGVGRALGVGLAEASGDGVGVGDGEGGGTTPPHHAARASRKAMMEAFRPVLFMGAKFSTTVYAPIHEVGNPALFPLFLGTSAGFPATAR